MREFFKAELKKHTAGFQDGCLQRSDNNERFFGFCAQDIVLQEAVADPDIDVSEVSSVQLHTLDWSNRQQL